MADDGRNHLALNALENGIAGIDGSFHSEVLKDFGPLEGTRALYKGTESLKRDIAQNRIDKEEFTGLINRYEEILKKS